MTRSLLERRLAEVSEQLKQLRRELSVADEQLAHFADEADEARIRSLVSETPIAEREHRDAERHAAAMQRHRADLHASIERLERAQDELLDKLIEAAGNP
jgi:chromosome segregation ATPase